MRVARIIGDGQSLNALILMDEIVQFWRDEWDSRA